MGPGGLPPDGSEEERHRVRAASSARAFEDARARREESAQRRRDERDEALRRRDVLAGERSALEKRRSLLTLRGESLEKQLALHRRMLGMLKIPAEKAKKMKGMLALQREVTSGKKEALELLSAIDGIREKEEEVTAGLIRAPSQSSSHHHHHNPAQPHTPLPPPPPRRTFALDKRTRTLRVAGLAPDVDEAALREGFGAFGDLAGVEIAVKNGGGGDKEVRADGSGDPVEASAVVAMVTFVSRASAEQVSFELVARQSMAKPATAPPLKPLFINLS